MKFIFIYGTVRHTGVVKREIQSERCVEDPGAAPSGVLAWIAAGVGMLLFALAAVALVAELITEAQFCLLSAAGLASYFSAHCIGVSYHT